MKDFNTFLNSFDKEEFIKEYEKTNKEYKEENNRNYDTYVFLNFQLLKLYHDWLFKNFDIKPKD